MATALFDKLEQLIDQNLVSTVASRLGENPQNVSRGLRAAATSILGGLASKTNDSSAMSRVFNLVTSPDQDFRSTTDPAALADLAGQSSAAKIGAAGKELLGDLFGTREAAVGEAVAKSSGVNASSAGALLRMGAPMVLGLLHRAVSERGLNVGSFTSMLSGERDEIMRAAPSGLANILGGEQAGSWRSMGPEVPFQGPVTQGAREPGAREPGARERGEQFTPYQAPGGMRGRPRWVWPVVALLVVLALFWGSRNRMNRQAPFDTSAVGGEVAPSPESIPSPTPSPTIGTTTTVRLPDGSTLTVVPTGIESGLVAFVGDPARRPDSASWFAFDRLRFENGSSKLTPESDEQVSNVAKILKTYPNVAVKIGGYGDLPGTSQTNQRLSAERAATVRAALVRGGVAPNRITAQGYGSQPPAGDTSAAGAAPGRQVTLLVVRK